MQTLICCLVLRNCVNKQCQPHVNRWKRSWSTAHFIGISWKIHRNGDDRLEMKRFLILGRMTMTNWNKILSLETHTDHKDMYFEVMFFPYIFKTESSKPPNEENFMPLNWRKLLSTQFYKKYKSFNTPLPKKNPRRITGRTNVFFGV